MTASRAAFRLASLTFGIRALIFSMSAERLSTLFVRAFFAGTGETSSVVCLMEVAGAGEAIMMMFLLVDGGKR